MVPVIWFCVCESVNIDVFLPQKSGQMRIRTKTTFHACTNISQLIAPQWSVVAPSMNPISLFPPWTKITALQLDILTYSGMKHRSTKRFNQIFILLIGQILNKLPVRLFIAWNRICWGTKAGYGVDRGWSEGGGEKGWSWAVMVPSWLQIRPADRHFSDRLPNKRTQNGDMLCSYTLGNWKAITGLFSSWH